LTVVKSRRGVLILVEPHPTTKTGKKKKRKLNPHEQSLAHRFEPRDDSLIPQYVLLKEVTIPKREFMGLSDAAFGRIIQLVMEHATGQDQLRGMN
jgi:hypothetical protein